jgi:DNA-binding NtrC family response regulator
MPSLLIVDDNARFLDSLVEFLARADASFEVRGARNGRDALELLGESPADVIVTDILMPETDGLEVIVQSLRATATTKVIAMSGGGTYVGTDTLRVARRLGAARVLVKPFDYKELLRVIHELLAPPPVPVECRVDRKVDPS